ncbi:MULTISPECIES: bifunctional allantoicase/(S)-ureidoglycine aminohydrolase [Arthrobacter]|uniref:Bifunctional allantoicase/(S)-ureidoglycine aminohydrolase n=1 Tax=Arthrobacter jinronghuae TaxID=2964609 RepID=A0ABT1NM69_9MICC|nr:bifunctional allantoicase/(S)-ureidoglycine aminohydrolase [Arthrobacter jinronghuae]MCC9173763.1 (S)-ureidoglycine aminohydrolase [Arthrobacter sp. zg-Y179]MCQ1952141.1 bifunctional allantoicase/(S)-ureidoglycine aminohydrolase [Arthrobacter sp. zg-Y238]MCQ1948815.1 bifunctional allantoicase/(S)-ureidoglycine aminohydrolase [Arthrobacter jinronghuae]MCQ1955722.1 bifunctional allantoicase/(S)-ureidoglycine aminohydrolase [Arthrobacter jinronghuae]UWX78375.1 bifunctional allantoicase/(S)-ure
MNTPRYYAPEGGLPAQTDLLTGRAVVTEAYTVIPRGVLRDIVVSVLPEWTDTRAWILNRPVAGGATTFAQYLMEVAPGGGSRAPEPELEVQSFIFVLEGTLTVRRLGRDHELTPGGFAYLPPETLWGAFNEGQETVKFAWIRKAYQPLVGHTPAPVFGNEADIAPTPMPGTDNKWRTTRMIPVDDVAYDMHVNVVTFEPGAVIPFAETHVMEHGLYVLEGKAVYRLNQDWVEVEEGDYLSLRAFCPQACYAGGPSNFRYLLYKDVNRQVLLGGR